MTYDCFTFFNELELLELRLHELGEVADRFVLVEATKTHSNQSKPLYYQDNCDRFSRFRSRIVHVVVDDMPDSTDSWRLENFQRNCIARGLSECRPEDFILVSDLDEIPRAASVARVREEWAFNTGLVSELAHSTLNAKWFKAIFHRKDFRRLLRKRHPFVLKFEQVLYRHFVNCRRVDGPLVYGTRMLRYRDFSCAEEVRHTGYKIVRNGGWHFSFMGGAARISEKLKAYAHQERNRPSFTDVEGIQRQITRGGPIGGMDYRLETVALDKTFPHYLLAKRSRFSSK